MDCDVTMNKDAGRVEYELVAVKLEKTGRQHGQKGRLPEIPEMCIAYCVNRCEIVLAGNKARGRHPVCVVR